MFGRIVFCSVTAMILCGAIIWSLGLVPLVTHDGGQAIATPPTEVRQAPSAAKKTELGGNLYAMAKLAPLPAQAPEAPDSHGIVADPIVIPNSRLGVIMKQDVPSQREGVLLFIGIEMKDGEQAPKDEPAWDVQIGGATKRFRRLKEGDRVEAGQLLAVVDDTLAKADFSIKDAKVAAAQADQIASEKTRDEALKRYETQRRLYNDGVKGSTSLEDLRGAELTYVRYIYEAKSKVEAIKVAEQEREQAKKIVSMHEIRAKIPGVVKAIYKHTGEAVASTNSSGKNADPVLQIQNYDLLRIEGLVDEQYARDLQPGMQVVIEPTRRERPIELFKGHRMDITAVAVTNTPQKPLILSASEDNTVRVWDPASRKERGVLQHPTAVRSLACTPVGVSSNLCLTGSADGRGRIWDLAGSLEKPLRELASQHRGAMTAVAFSPDGKICATGGEDGEIMLWNTDTGELRYSISGHRTVVTALQFTPKSELVSTSRDNTIRVWQLLAEGATQVGDPIRRRSSDVAQLGVSPDGKYVLDAQGQEMRILSLPHGMADVIFQNPSQSSTFKTFALFSPDGRLVLTTSSNEGILQLWRPERLRSYEIRQFVPADRLPVTCAAFAPDGSFVVCATRDRRIYVFRMPTAEEVSHQLKAVVTNVERSVESSESQVRVMAEFRNPATNGLLPGDVVTMVAYPTK